MSIHYIEDTELQKIVEAIKETNKMGEGETFSGADIAELIKERKLFKLMFDSYDPSSDGVFYEITEKDLEGVTVLRSYAFCGIKWLKKITIPECVVSYGNNIFNGCVNLEEIHLSSSMTNTGTTGFSTCYKLKKVNVENIKTVVSGGFQKCYELEKLDFHNLVYIFTSGFNGCKKLSTLIIRTNSVCSLYNINAFTDTPIASGEGFVYVPDDLVESYKTAENWVTYASQIKPLSELQEGAE